MILLSEKEFTCKINERNSIRYEIKQKKNTIAKLRYHPEALDDCSRLEHEIHNLEKQLNSLKSE